MEKNNYNFNLDSNKDNIIILLFLIFIVLFSFYQAYYYSQQPNYNVKCVLVNGTETFKTDNYSNALTFAQECENKMMLPKPQWHDNPLNISN